MRGSNKDLDALISKLKFQELDVEMRARNSQQVMKVVGRNAPASKAAKSRYEEAKMIFKELMRQYVELVSPDDKRTLYAPLNKRYLK